MQLKDVAERIHMAAGRLRNGYNPAEIADDLDGLGVAVGEAVTQSAPSDHSDMGAVMESIRDSLAALEERQRQDSGFAQRVCLDLAETDQRLDNLANAMREVTRKDALHPSVRFLADTIALNLSAPTGAVNGDQIATMADAAYERAKQRTTGGGQGV